MKVIEDLKKHAGDLDHNVYKVMVVWDPNLSRDVGWLTVLKEAKVHLPHLQVRDVNMSAFATNMQLLDEMSLSDDLDKSLNLSQEVVCVRVKRTMMARTVRWILIETF